MPIANHEVSTQGNCQSARRITQLVRSLSVVKHQRKEVSFNGVIVGVHMICKIIWVCKYSKIKRLTIHTMNIDQMSRGCGDHLVGCAPTFSRTSKELRWNNSVNSDAAVAIRCHMYIFCASRIKFKNAEDLYIPTVIGSRAVFLPTHTLVHKERCLWFGSWRRVQPGPNSNDAAGHTDELMDVTMGTLEQASARKTCVLS